MAVPLRYGPTPRMAAQRIRAHPLQHMAVVDPGFNFNAGGNGGASPPYTRPRFSGHPVIEDNPPAQRPAVPLPPGWLGAGPAYGPEHNQPPPPGPVGLPFNQGAPGQGHGLLSWNPQLLNPHDALQGYTDSGFESDITTARAALMKSYHETLKNLGYMDTAGNPVTGEYDLGDRRSRGLLMPELGREEQTVTNNSRDLGTLWSGVRARDLADAQRETVQSLADLDINTPRNIAQGYTDIEGQYGDYNTAINAAINAAIARRTASYGP